MPRTLEHEALTSHAADLVRRGGSGRTAMVNGQ